MPKNETNEQLELIKSLIEVVAELKSEIEELKDQQAELVESIANLSREGDDFEIFRIDE